MFIFTPMVRTTCPVPKCPHFSISLTAELPLTLRSICQARSPSLRERIGFLCRPGKTSIRTVNGFGTTEPSNQVMRTPHGRTQGMATPLVASLGTERAPAWRTKYRLTKFFRSSASRRVIRPVRHQPRRPQPRQLSRRELRRHHLIVLEVVHHRQRRRQRLQRQL